MASTVIAAAPNAQWRLMIALSRYGGIRTPSETLLLRWQDIDWEHGRILISSPKTSHQGKPCRIIPLFPELRQPLLECFEQAQPGEQFVITQYHGGSACNLRTQLHKIIVRAGLQPWPRLWHNMRASRQTELAKTWPLHVVCSWIGNSKAIAQEHYLQITDADFERACGQPESTGAGAVQNAVQYLHETPCMAVKPETETCDNSRESTSMHVCAYKGLPPTGFEPVYAD